MTTPAPAPPATGALLADLFDDASLFPPASLPMSEAFDGHRIALGGGYRWMLARFVVPTSRLRELAGVATHFGDALRVSLLVDDDIEADDIVTLVDEHGWRVEAVEGLLRDADVARGASTLVDTAEIVGAERAFLELPWRSMSGAGLAEAIGSVRVAGGSVKLRCGGPTAAAFPDPATLGSMIASCRDEGVAFKATAGLHHPFRHPDPDVGVLSHGFVNLLAAAAIAHSRGASAAELAEVIAEEGEGAFALHGGELRWGDVVVDAAAIAASRRELFVSVGTCSFREPVDDLVALGVLAVP